MKTVKVYDFETRTMSEIPAAELAPGMIPVDIQGVGHAYVRAETVRDSSTRKELPEGFEDIASAVWEILRTELGDTLDEWLEAFRSDAHPVRELTMWMSMAAVYHEMTHGGKDAPDVRRDVYSVLVASMNDRKHPLETVGLKRISMARARTIVERHTAETQIEDMLIFWRERVDLETLDRLVKEEPKD